MNVSSPESDPPLAKFGETHTTRPATSDATFTVSSRPTVAVNSTVSAWSVGAG